MLRPFDIEYGVQFIRPRMNDIFDVHMNDIAGDILSSKYLPSRTRTTYVGYIRGQELCINE